MNKEYSLANGDKYIGEVYENKRHGKGKYIFNNGDSIECLWNDNKINDQITYSWTNGSKYKGEWKNGHPVGRGVYFNNNSAQGSVKFIDLFEKKIWDQSKKIIDLPKLLVIEEEVKKKKLFLGNPTINKILDNKILGTIGAIIVLPIIVILYGWFTIFMTIFFTLIAFALLFFLLIIGSRYDSTLPKGLVTIFFIISVLICLWMAYGMYLGN